MRFEPDRIKVVAFDTADSHQFSIHFRSKSDHVQDRFVAPRQIRVEPGEPRYRLDRCRPRPQWTGRSHGSAAGRRQARKGQGLIRTCRVFLLLLPAILLPAPAGSAPNASRESRKTELKEQQSDLRERIDALRRDLAKSEETRADAADQLRDAETAISAANRRLRELADDKQAVTKELAALDAQSRQLDRQSATQQAQLEQLLRQQFAGGESDALQLLLAGKDPNQSARDRYFLTKLSRAKAELIVELRSVAAKKKKLADSARERREQLATIEQRQQAGRAQLLTQQKTRQALLQKIAGKVKSQRRELGALKRDEQRLGKLIAGLARIAATRRKPKVSLGGTAPSDADGPSAPVVARGGAVRNADPGAVGEFGAMRGKLRLPTNGTVASRFGAQRDEAGTSWRGIFIRAAEGAEVHAVAAGTVVFSDWLRGFGNLLIVDHGDDFLSIYGNNQSLLRGAGQAVKNGETIATVGSTGGNPEPGLYFELRHRGQPFDPLNWTRR